MQMETEDNPNVFHIHADGYIPLGDIVEHAQDKWGKNISLVDVHIDVEKIDGVSYLRVTKV